MTKYHALTRQAWGDSGGRELTRKWLVGLLLSAALLGGISLAARAKVPGGKDSRNSSGDATSAGKSEATATSTGMPAKPESKPRGASASSTGNASAKAPKTATPGGAARSKHATRNANAGSATQSGGERDASSSGVLKPEEESSDLILRRAQWFHDQRAYPLAHIPSGAYQKALQQRDAMLQRQRLSNAGILNAQALITFPGDGLWHLMGPQPTNRPFGNISGLGNSGYPTSSGRITAIAADPTDATGNTVYVGGAAGGVWKTTDGGNTWTPLTDFQPSLAVGSIAIDPNNNQTIYVGTGEDNFNQDGYYGAGILKSTNGGSTWTQLGASVFSGAKSSGVGGAQIGGIAVQPGNSQIVLASVFFFDGPDPNGGIWRSTDGGVTWNQPTTGAQGSAGTGVVFDPASNIGTTATAYAALGDVFGPSATSNGIWKSTDSGNTWTKLGGGLPTTNVGRITLGYAAGTTGTTATIYAAIADSSTNSSNFLGLFKTTNAGTSWSSLTGPGGGFCNGQCFYDMAVGVDPRNASNVVLGGGAYSDNFTSLFESKDGGSTWTGTAGDDFSGPVTGTHPHVDTHAIVFTPNGTTFRLYVGNDGGLWRTDTPTPSGVSPTWVDGNAGLALTQFYPGPTAAIGDENSGFGGSQDNDTEEFTGTLDWTGVDACGDGGFTAIDNQYPTTIYTACAPGSGPGLVMKSVFNGGIVGGNPTFNPADTGIAHESSLFIPPVAIDDSSAVAPNLYYGTCRVFQSTNGGASWAAITGDLPSGTNSLGAPCGGAGSITNFDIAHSSTGVVVAGTSNGKIWETLSASLGLGSTWTEIDNLVPGQLPARHVTAVRTKRTDGTGQIVYAAFSGFGSCAGCDGKGHVFKTTNGGATWTDISGDLPDTPVNDIIVDDNSNPTFDALYIGTDVGVFSCPNPEASPACSNWTVVGDGLPNSPVLGLAMRRSSRILHAATHGRSMWDIQLRDEQPSAVAALSSLTPAAVFVGATTTNVTINGVNFSTNTQVLFGGVSVGTPTFVSTTQLTVAVNASLFQAGIVYSVTLNDPAGADTGSLPFTVMNPILTATNMTPSSTTAGTAVTLVFTGTNFVSNVNGLGGTAVTFNNVQLFGGTALAGGTSFSVKVPVELLITAGPATVTITNPLPGGGPTPPISFPFTINPGTIIFNPNPITLGTFLNTTTPVANVSIINTSASPATITAQSITGTNAANFSFANPIPGGTSCNFPSSGQTGTGSVTLAANGGTCNFGITYFANPVTPGNAASIAALSVTDNASGSPQSAPVQGTPFPTVVVLSPVIFGAVTVGTTSPTMNATLANGTTAPVNVTSAFSIAGTNAGDFHIVPFVSNGDKNSACPAAPFALPAPPNPASSCDVSLTFTPSLPPSSETAQLNVTASVAVTTSTPNLFGIGIEITSISPEIVATGGPAFTLTVNGGGFASSAVVNVNGSARLTTFVNSGLLQASIPASDIAAAGSLAISVTTPNPGGTTSEPKTLIVAQAAPATNDNVNFAVAVLLANLPFRITQDTTQATTQSVAFTGSPATPVDPLPCASGSKAKSVWFFFTPTASGKVVADTRFSSYSTILSAWTISTPLPSSTATFAPVACNTGNVPASGSAPAASLITFPVTSGTTYYLMVTDGGGTGAGGTLTLSLDFAAPPAPTNDNNATPTVIAAAPFSNTENTIEATANTGGNADPTPPCTVGAAGLVGSGQDNSVWYEYTPTSNGTITADTLISPYITILNVTSGSPTGTQVACNQSAAAGIAQSQVSFAATSGTQYFFMVSSFLGDGGTTNFHLTFNATTVGPATKLAFTQEPTNVAASASIAPAVTVTIQDASGNTVTTATNQVTVAILNNAGGGTLSGTLTQSPTNGVATFSNLSINKVGTGYTLTATANPALTAATSSAFNVTAGSAATVAATSGSGQSATISTAFAAPLAATVTDSGGNPVSGVVVTFTPPASGASGTFAGGANTATTNASGVATSAVFTANATAGGPYNVVASATGATSASFSLTNNSGAAAKVTATSGSGQSATISTAFAAPLVATVTDSGGNPVSGVVVTFSPPASGASGTFAGGVNTATTNASGVATSAVFTANATAGGPYNVVASAAGATSANFSLTNKTGAAAKVSATSGTPQSAAINTAFATALGATVTDSGGNPVSGVVVTFTPPASGASGTFAGGANTATTNASGVATSAVFTANATAGGPYNVVASATGAASANFVLTNLSGTPAKVAVSNGSGQATTINAAFAAPLAALVTDASNNPVSGVVVTFTPPASGASGTFAGGVNTATTNASGVATSAVFTANSTAGTYNVVASATGATAVNFSLTNNAGAAAKVAATSGSGQAATINAAFAATLVATVTDSGGNPVSGVVVTFTAPASGASGTFAGGVNTATTNVSGVATSAVFTANSKAGTYSVVASATGATSANFSLTNNAGAAATVTATSGSGQAATVSTAFGAPLVATVTDSGGNPVSGVVVTFTPPASGASGTFAGGANTATTNSSGVATSATFTANSTAGTYNVVASATGATSANFSLTNNAGAAAKVTATSGSGQSATISTAFVAPLVATVTDSGGNPVSGVVVTFTPPASGASGTFAGGVNTATTNAIGVATSATFTANSTAGAYNVVASATGATSANFSLTNKAGTAAKVSATSGTPQSAAINTAFAAALGATVTDSGGNPVSGVVVTFTPPASGASGTFAGGANTATTNASGVATSAVFTANATAGGPYNVVASATGATSANFVLTNLSGTPSKVATTSGTPQSTAISTAFANPFVVTVTDASSNPVSGVVVTFTPPASGPSGTFAGGVNTAATNASGVATSATFTANSTAGGPYDVVASATGATSADFVLTNNAGAAAKVAATSGSGQAATINAAFAAPLVATVTDSGGNPVSGVVVTFTAPASGASGTFAGGVNTATTNVSGVATSAVFTANSKAGTYSVVASATGATSANFSLTNNAGAAATVTASSGSGQAATINTAFAASLAATVTDSGGNPVSGVVVTFTPPASGASGSFAAGGNTGTSNTSGVATSGTFTADGTSGTYNVVASATGATSANFSLTNNAGPPASITATSGTPQTVVIGTAYAALQAVVKDSGGNLATGAAVTFTAPSSGASGKFANGTNTVTVNTDNTGTATATTFTANFTNGGPYQVNATVSGVNSPASFALTNTSNVPTITAPLVPASATAGGAAFVLTLNGANFATASVVNFNGVAKATTFVSGTQLTANISAADIATAATVNVTVTTPAPGGGTSSAVQFAINNPVPTITTVAPTSATVGGAAFALTVTGTNFVATSVVNFNGAAKVTTFNSSTQLTAAITTADIANAGIVNVTVTNPAPGGGTSNPPAQFTVNNVQPVLTTLSPTSTLAGSPAFTLTVNGNAGSFVTGAVVTFNGTPTTTTFVNSSQLTANITAADIATASKVNVIVSNPAPAVGPSAALTFTVNNPVPTITAAASAGQNHIAGGAAFTLTVTGTNFVTGTNEASVVSFNGKTEATTFVSGTQITASIPAADVATAGVFNVSVANPGPGGGPTPTTVAFTIDGYTIAGPGSTVTVKAGVQAVFPVTITPTANGFANAVVFSVTGLPANSSLVPLTIPNVATKTTVNVTINTTASGEAPPTSPLNRPVPPTVRILLVTWLCALLAGIYAVMLIRRRPQFRRYAVLVPMALLMVSGVILAGCATAMKGTPMGTSQLTITATSGTLAQSAPATMTVQ